MNIGHREAWGAVLVLALVLGAFFWSPIRAGSGGAWSTADLTQDWPITRVDEGHRPANPLLSDPPFQMQPWFLLARSELLAGRLPLWNPYNGAGQPLFANYQAGLLSPFHLPLWVLGLPAGLWLAAALKSSALAVLTYLLLRQWQLAWPAAAFGAFAFAFCGHNVLCLAYPHPGALVALPGGLYFAERAFAAWKAAQGTGLAIRAHWPHLGGLALCFGVAALAGHPEPYFFAALGTGALVLFRLAQLAVESRTSDRTRATGSVLGLAGAFFAAALLGTLLAAVQILPFLEYLSHSSAIHTRGEFNQEPLALTQWPLLFYPDLLGNPSSDFRPRLNLPVPNYEGANMLYPSALALVLAALGGFSRRGRGAARALVVGLALWFLYAYDIGGLAQAAAHVPLLSHAPVWRSQPLALFAVAALAAFGLDLLLARRDGGRARVSLCLALVTVACGLVWAFSKGAQTWLGDLGEQLGPVDRLAQHAGGHMAQIHTSLALGVTAAAAMPWLVRRPLRVICCTAVLGALLFQTAWLFADYNPTIERRHFFPRTPAVETLADAVGGGLLMTVDGEHLPPESNSAYGIPMLSHYDALAVSASDYLLLGLLDAAPVGRFPRTVTQKGLRLFGGTHLLHRAPVPRLETEWGSVWKTLRTPAEPIPLTRERELAQTWSARRGRARAINLVVAVEPARLDGGLSITLEDLDSRATLLQRNFGPRELLDALQLDARQMGLQVGELVLPLPPSSDPPGGSHGSPRRWRLAVRGSAETAEGAPTCLLHPDGALPGGSFERDGKPTPGCLRADISHSLGAFDVVAQVAGLRLSRYTEGLGRYFCVDQWRSFDDHAPLLRFLVSPEFDPYRLACLGPGAPAAPPLPPSDPHGPRTAQSVEVLVEHPGLRRLRVERDRPGLLVIAQNHFPGWRATVNGNAAPLWKANYAFTSVFVPAGSSMVELRYSPRSLYLGAALSLLTLALMVFAYRGAGVRRGS